MAEERENKSVLLYKWDCVRGCGTFEAPMPEHGRPDCPECNCPDTGDGVIFNPRETTT